MDIPMNILKQILGARRMGTVKTLFRTAMNAENLRLYEVALVEQERHHRRFDATYEAERSTFAKMDSDSLPF